MLLGTSPVQYEPPVNPYTATLNTLAAVPADITKARTDRHLSLQDQAAAIGIGVDTLIKLGPTSSRATVEKCLSWLAKGA